MDRYGYNRANQTKTSISPFIIYTIIIFLIYVLPYMKVKVPYIISGMLMLVFLPIAVLKKKKWMKYVICLLALSGVNFLLDIVSGGYSFIESFNEVIRNIRFFTPVLWTMYALEYCNERRYKQLLIIFATVTGMILFKTINALEQNQWIARILAKGKTQDTLEIRAYRLQNIGGFEFSYMMGIVTICLVWTVIKVKSKAVRLVCICASAVSFYYIIQTMYTTLLLLTVTCVLILLICNIKKPLIKVIVIVIFFIFALGLAPFFEFLSSLFTNSLLSVKFMQMHDALTGAGINALGSRPEHILEALTNWIHSPLIGGYNIGTTAHSTIFATLEKNGLVGLLSFFIMFYQSWKLLLDGTEELVLNVVMLYVLVLSFLNPIGYVFEITIMAFFIMPLWSVLIVDKHEKRHEKNISSIV